MHPLVRPPGRWLRFGNLNNGLANAGFSCGNGNNGLSNANWNIGGRIFEEMTDTSMRRGGSPHAWPIPRCGENVSYRHRRQFCFGLLSGPVAEATGGLSRKPKGPEIQKD